MNEAEGAQTPEPTPIVGTGKLPNGDPIITVEDVEEGSFIDGEHTDSQW